MFVFSADDWDKTHILYFISIIITLSLVSLYVAITEKQCACVCVSVFVAGIIVNSLYAAVCRFTALPFLPHQVLRLYNNLYSQNENFPNKERCVHLENKHNKNKTFIAVNLILL